MEEAGRGKNSSKRARAGEGGGGGEGQGGAPRPFSPSFFDGRSNRVRLRSPLIVIRPPPPTHLSARPFALLLSFSLSLSSLLFSHLLSLLMASISSLPCVVAVADGRRLADGAFSVVAALVVVAGGVCSASSSPRSSRLAGLSQPPSCGSVIMYEPLPPQKAIKPRFGPASTPRAGAIGEGEKEVTKEQREEAETRKSCTLKSAPSSPTPPSSQRVSIETRLREEKRGARLRAGYS